MLSKISPRQLSSGTEAVVVALSDTEAGKMYQEAADAAAEAARLEFANGVNGLLVRLIRQDQFESHAVLVLERLYPMDFRSIEVDKRKALVEVLSDELRELHEAGFVHNHLQREAGFTSGKWDNILLTEGSLRLIDAGRSLLRNETDEATFDAAVVAELQALDLFRDFILAR